MNTAGILLMSVSVGSVTLMFIWCLWRVLAKRPKHLHGIEDIDTQDK